MSNPTKYQLQAKYKRAQAALLNLQADALEFRADQKFEKLSSELESEYNQMISKSESFLQELKLETENVASDTLDAIDEQMYSLHNKLRNIKSSLKSKN